jgi:hypothetical protein
MKGFMAPHDRCNAPAGLAMRTYHGYSGGNAP